MLHELLLALSGHPSPLLSDEPLPHTLFSPSVSPAEAALLKSTAHLGNLHISVREQCSQISSSHASVICRAVATAITSTHLAQFQKDIVQVERDILLEDASLVGAYQVVPLSAIACAFEGWSQRLQWLQSTLAFALGVNAGEKTKVNPLASNTNSASGAALIDKLRSETRTGYPAIEKMAQYLTRVAELAWLRHMSTWVLYGRLPTLGAADFFIRQESNAEAPFNAWDVDSSLLPGFVSSETARSILFVGKCLHYIQSIDLAAPNTSKTHVRISQSRIQLPKEASGASLQSRHFELLASLSHPISSTALTQTISAIRSSLSQNVLQKMLSFTEILLILHVFREFFLLQRGEFAIALINAADSCLATKSQTSAHTVKGGDMRMSGVMIKEGEVTATLNQAWATLASLQEIDDDEDQELDLARDLVYLTIKKVQTKTAPAPAPTGISSRLQLGDLFRDVLLATPTVLTMRTASPLDLFLTVDDIEMYSQMHAFLLSIRRAQSHLSDLWKLTILRRDHSTAPMPRVREHNGEKPSTKLQSQRNQRMRRMRRVWNKTGLATAFLVEVGEYFHGEVVTKSWERFESWFSPIVGHDVPPNDHREDVQSRQSPGKEEVDGVIEVAQPTHDPETLMQAHQAFLGALSHSLLLDDASFARSLRALFTKVDYLVGLMGRLSNLRLQSEARISHATASQDTEEDEVMGSIDRAGTAIEKEVDVLRRRLRVLDSERLGENLEVVRIEGEELFTPWRAAGLDRLLLKVDFGTMNE